MLIADIERNKTPINRATKNELNRFLHYIRNKEKLNNNNKKNV